MLPLFSLSSSGVDFISSIFHFPSIVMVISREYFSHRRNITALGLCPCLSLFVIKLIFDSFLPSQIRIKTNFSSINSITNGQWNRIPKSFALVTQVEWPFFFCVLLFYLDKLHQVINSGKSEKSNSMGKMRKKSHFYSSGSVEKERQKKTERSFLTYSSNNIH